MAEATHDARETLQKPAPIADFLYWDGEKTVSADRWPLYRDIFRRTGGKPNELANKVFSVTPDTTDINKLLEANDAAEQLEALVREVFKMQPMRPGGGARWEHCLAVWESFCECMDDEKKNAVTSQTTASLTDSPQASSQATPNTSA
jgi:hypothetical protein